MSNEPQFKWNYDWEHDNSVKAESVGDFHRCPVEDIIEMNHSINQQIASMNEQLRKMTPEEIEKLRKIQFPGKKYKNNEWKYWQGMPDKAVPLSFVKIPVKMATIQGFHYDEKTRTFYFLEAYHRRPDLMNFTKSEKIKVLQKIVEHLSATCNALLICCTANESYNGMEHKIRDTSEMEIFYCYGRSPNDSYLKVHAEAVGHKIKEVFEGIK